MSQHQAWISLESVINDYLGESEQSNSRFFKLWHIAFRGMEKLGIDFFYQIKSVKLPINANKTVTLPADYLNYTKIGVLNGVGEVVPLKYNENLTTYADLQPDRIADISSPNFANYYSYSSPNFFNFWGDGGYYNLYGVTSASFYGGGFKVDNTNGVILLDSVFSFSNLILEYIASPTEGQEYYVPVQFREALIAWIAWRDIISVPSKTHVHNSHVNMRKKEFYNERRLAMAAYKPFHLEQAYIQNVESMRMVVKT